MQFGYIAKFHGTFKIQWNSMELLNGYSDSMEFHGIWLCSQIPWNFLNFMEFHGIFVLGLAIPWNSMEFGVGINFHQFLWNLQSSMEFNGTSFLTWKSSMEFHVTFGEFYGIPWNIEILILMNFIIEEVYFTVCCMTSCYYISDNAFVIEILRYFKSKATFWWPSFCTNGDIPL